MSIKKTIKERLHGYLLENKRKHTNRVELLSTLDGIRLDELTQAEIKAIRDTWGDFMDGKLTYEYWKLYKTFGHFSEKFVPDDAYIPYIIRTLNPLHPSRTLADKGLYPIRFKGINQPKVLVNKIRGVYYDCDNEYIKIEDVFSILKKEGTFIIKKTKGSCSGLGVRKIDLGNSDNLQNILKEFGEDFICQGVVDQSDATKKFHPASLNTFRVNTLNLNGRVSVDTIMFKHGNNNSCVDNGHAGGVFIGVDKDGRFKENAYDAFYKMYPVSPSGIIYKDVVMPQVKDMISEVMLWHKHYFPDMGFIGWDVALDKDDKPVFIEANLSYPGILIVQLSADKPIFGNRTEEVMEYVNLHKNEIGISDLIAPSV